MIVFGGTFNPVHLGHLNIINKALDYFEKIKGRTENILIVPSFIPPFGEKEYNLIPYKERVKLLELAIKDYREIYPKGNNNIEISTIEEQLGGKVYTSMLISYLKEHYSINDKVGFLAGSDIFSGFDRWKDLDYLKQNVTFYIYPRGDNAQEAINNRKLQGFSIEFINGILYSASSTEIRGGMLKGMLSPRVAKEYCKLAKLS